LPPRGLKLRTCTLRCYSRKSGHRDCPPLGECSIGSYSVADRCIPLTADKNAQGWCERNTGNGSTHRDRDTQHPAWNQQDRHPGPGNSDSTSHKIRTLNGLTSSTSTWMLGEETECQHAPIQSQLHTRPSRTGPILPRRRAKRAVRPLRGTWRSGNEPMGGLQSERKIGERES